MKISRNLVVFCAVSSFISIASAGPIVNGGFDDGLNGWNTDTDGFAGSPNDFSVNGGKARVEADYWSTAGDPFSAPVNDVYFANTLYQGLDFTANAGDSINLSFSWEFGGEGLSGDLANEIFLVGLNDGLGNYYGADGNLGFLIDPTLDYGSGSYSVALDSSFANQVGWFLDFQIGVGVDDQTFYNDAYGSFAEIDDVALNIGNGDPVSVPEPSTLWLLLAGLGALVRQRVFK